MLNDILKKCRSFRSFAPEKKIPEEKLLEFIDNARISAATRNLQPLKYRIVSSPEELARCNPELRYAASLGIKLPPDGHEATSLIVICHDTDITPFTPIYLKDIGICAEVIMLSATEAGYGGCMIGSYNAEALAKALSLPENLMINLVLALGAPDETAVLCEAEDGKVKYYRDENNVHYVPKRKLEDIIIK